MMSLVTWRCRFFQPASVRHAHDVIPPAAARNGNSDSMSRRIESRFAKVDVACDEAGFHMKPGSVELFGSGGCRDSRDRDSSVFNGMCAHGVHPGSRHHASGF